MQNAPKYCISFADYLVYALACTETSNSCLILLGKLLNHLIKVNCEFRYTSCSVSETKFLEN